MENRKLFNSSRLKRFLKREGTKENRAAKVLCDPKFPLYYVLRNLGWLNTEKWWRNLSPRARRVRALKMVRERIAMFNEIKDWRKNRKAEVRFMFAIEGLPFDSTLDGPGQIQEPPSGDILPPAYCNKCGLCCEVASGMPDFPAPAALPLRWREIFANGLGRGHRFCPFLWEDSDSGGGFCSIYPLRSNPCRLFAFEECDFFRKSSEPAELSGARNILLIGRWLFKEVKRKGQLNLRRVETWKCGKFLSSAPEIWEQESLSYALSEDSMQ